MKCEGARNFLNTQQISPIARAIQSSIIVTTLNSYNHTFVITTKKNRNLQYIRCNLQVSLGVLRTTFPKNVQGADARNRTNSHKSAVVSGIGR